MSGHPTDQPMPTARRKPGTVSERMREWKASALGAAMGKSEDWSRKLLDGDAGVRLEDLPQLLEVLGLKLVDKSKVCIDPALARAYETIVRKAVREHELIWEDAE